MTTHYEVLGVDQTATFQEIKAAYRQLLLRLHPDKAPSRNGATQQPEQLSQHSRRSTAEGSHSAADTQYPPLETGMLDPGDIRSGVYIGGLSIGSAEKDASAADGFLAVQAAWDVLHDSVTRAQYDCQLALEASHQQDIHIQEEVPLSEMVVEGPLEDPLKDSLKDSLASEPATSTHDASAPPLRAGSQPSGGEPGTAAPGGGHSPWLGAGVTYCWPCRCGGNFRLRGEDFEGGEVIVPCCTCSLHILVDTFS